MEGLTAADPPPQPPGAALRTEPAVSFNSGAAASDERDERDVIERAKAGDQACCGVLFDRYFIRLFSYIRARVSRREDAEDLAMACMERMLNGLPRYQQREIPFRAWLFRIASNLVTDHYRRQGTGTAAAGTWSIEQEELDLADERAGADPESIVGLQLQMEEVARAMDQLTELEREVIRLRYAAELSIAETAAALGKTENNIKQLTYKGLGKLRKAMDR
jgi:RNA polymerase sigma-70 factor (ECF subfamily)